VLNLYTGIMAKTVSSTLSTLVGGRIYSGSAPSNVQYPYVVFFSVGGFLEKTWTEDLRRLTIQFSIFSTSEALSEIAAIEAAIEALFDEQLVTVTSANQVWFIKMTEPMDIFEDVTPPDGSSKVTHWAVDYEVHIEKS
jgi:uncharacterized membrane protein